MLSVVIYDLGSIVYIIRINKLRSFKLIASLNVLEAFNFPEISDIDSLDMVPGTT